MDAAAGDPLGDFHEHLEAARQEFDAQTRRFEAARAHLQETLDRARKGRSQRELLHDSAFARLQARLDTMPVIEQAKGVLMAQNRCGPDEAFELLRRASQRANVKISVLATQIVEQVTSPEPDPPRRLAPHASAGAERKADGSAIRRARQRT
jgi:AmiR/NasT family two-component response regulator